MLLSRFWYLAISVVLAGAIFLLYLATAVSNRNATKTAGKLLTAASKAVHWYLTDDARRRAAALIPLTIDKTVYGGLAAASKADSLKEVKSDVKHKIASKLSDFRKKSADNRLVFDVLWAIDVHGRVVANENYERGTGSDYFEMGGYSVVADAIHGWIRDDAWVLDGQIYRVVAHPVETEVGGRPVGCIVGAKVVDAGYAQAISDRTGAALAFFAGGTRVATGAPANFDKAALEVHNADLEKVATDENYMEKGRTAAVPLRESAGFNVTVIYARMPGEAWDLGAGYVVGHRQARVRTPLEFESLADEADKESVPLILIILAALGAALIGLIFSIIEHTMPLGNFKRAVADLANKKSDTDVLKPSTFRGFYKKIASDVNASLDKVAAGAGIERGPADLESVLGPLPAEPQMSAFAVPKSNARPSSPQAEAALARSGGGSGPESSRSLPKRSLPKGKGVEQRDDQPSSGQADAQPSDKQPEGLPSADAFGAALRGDADASGEPASPADVAGEEDMGAAPPASADADPATEEEDEETTWRAVYADFIALKKQFGEATEKLTYEKFRGTLQRNKEALIARHGCQRVKFRVYEKQGRAALKASPVK